MPSNVRPRTEVATARIRAVAEQSMRSRYFFWDWGESIVTRGLLAAGRSICEPEYYRWVAHAVDMWLDSSPRPFWPDHLGPGDALLEYWEHSRNDRLIEHALLLGRHFESLPRSSRGAPLNRADKPDLAALVWVDSIHTDAPFLARLARASSDPHWADLAGQVALGQVDCLQDPASGLFAHAYSDATRTTNGIHWSRGCGWAALGLAETLRWLPDDHGSRAAIAAAFRSLATALRNHQAADGRWHLVVEMPDGRTEASASALIAEALSVGLEIGVLDTSFQSTRNLAWNSVHSAVKDGTVLDVSERQPVSADPQYYIARRFGTCEPYAQGPWLLLASRDLPLVTPRP